MGSSFSGEAETERKYYMLYREEQLASRVTEFKIPTTFNWPWFISRFSEGQGRVCVARNTLLQDLLEVPTKIGRDAVVGKELFFDLPFWWSFEHAERGSYLAQSVEILKQVGLISYFLDLHDSKSRKEFTTEAYMEMTAAEDAFGARNRDFSVPLMDSLVSETFALFLYGFSISVFGFVSEMVISHFKRLASALLHRMTQRPKKAKSSN